MSGKVHILMTGGGAPGAAGILKCLQKEKDFQVTIADADPAVACRYNANEFETIPIALAPLYAEEVMNVCKRKGINVLLPLVTKELLPLADYSEQFSEAGIRMPISTAASIEIANNKSRLYQFLQWRDIPLPAFRIVETIAQFKEALKELGYPENTVCFKPSVANGSRGFRIISEQMNELDLLFNHKPTSVYISYREAVRILSTGIFPELLVSEYLPGDEFSVDCLARQGEPVLVVPRSRKKMISGISVEGEFINDEKIISYCSRIIKELKLHGNTGIQVKRSAAGECLLLEINPRVQGSISTGLGAGINLPVLAIKQELGLPITSSETNIKWGTKFSRYWEEVFY